MMKPGRDRLGDLSVHLVNGVMIPEQLFLN